jgi:hypothetical protein
MRARAPWHTEAQPTSTTCRPERAGDEEVCGKPDAEPGREGGVIPMRCDRCHKMVWPWTHARTYSIREPGVSDFVIEATLCAACLRALGQEWIARQAFPGPTHLRRRRQGWLARWTRARVRSWLT